MLEREINKKFLSDVEADVQQAGDTSNQPLVSGQPQVKSPGSKQIFTGIPANTTGKPQVIVASGGGSGTSDGAGVGAGSGGSQQPLGVSVSEQWTGNVVARQTSGGKLTFVGWADPEKRFEVWRDESGKQYVHPVGSENWLSGEGFAKVQAEAQKFLQQVNVVELQTNPQLNTVVQRYFREGDKWYTLQYDPQTNSYKKVEVPAEKIQQTLFDKMLGSPVNVSGYNIQGIEKYAQKEPGEFVFSGALDAVRTARLKEIFSELAGKENVTLDDLHNVIAKRLEKYGGLPFDTIRKIAKTVFDSPDAWKAIESNLEEQVKEYSQSLSTYTDENKLKQLYEALRLSAPLNEDVGLRRHRAMLLENMKPQQYDMLPQVKSELQAVLGEKLPEWDRLSPEQKTIIAEYLKLSDPTLQKYVGDKVTLRLGELTDDQRKILSRFIGEDKVKGSEATLSLDDAKKVLAGLLYMSLHPEELYTEQIKKQYEQMYGQSGALASTLASDVVSSAITGAKPVPKQQNALDVGLSSTLRLGGLMDILGLALKAPPSTGQVTGEILSQASEELRRQYVLNKVKEKGAQGWWEAFGQDPYMALRVWWDPTAPGQFFGEVNKQLSNAIQATYNQPAPFHLTALPFVFAQMILNAPATMLDLVTKIHQTALSVDQAHNRVITLWGDVDNVSSSDIDQVVKKYGLDRFVPGWSGMSWQELKDVARMIKEGKIDKETLGALMAIRDTIPSDVASAYYIGDALGLGILASATDALRGTVKIDAPKGAKTIEDAEGWARRVFGEKARAFEEGGKIRVEVPKVELLKFKLLDKLPWDIELPKNIVEKYGKDIGKLREQIAKNIGDPNVEIYQAPDGKYYASTSWAYRVPLELEIAKAPIRDAVEKVKPRVEEPARKAVAKLGNIVEAGLDKSKQVYLEALKATKEELDKLLPEGIRMEWDKIAEWFKNKFLVRNRIVKVGDEIGGVTDVFVADRNVSEMARSVDGGRARIVQQFKVEKWVKPGDLQEPAIIEAIERGTEFLKKLREKYPDREFVGMAVVNNKGETWVKIYEVLPTEFSKAVSTSFEFLKRVFKEAGEEAKKGEKAGEVKVGINNLLTERDPYEVAVYKIFYEVGDKERSLLVGALKSIPWDKIKDWRDLEALLQKDEYKALRKFGDEIRDLFGFGGREPKTIEEAIKIEGTEKFTGMVEMDVFKRLSSKDLDQLKWDADYVAGYLLRNMSPKEALKFIAEKLFKGDDEKVEVLKGFVENVEKTSKELVEKLGKVEGVAPDEVEKALVDYVANYNAQLKGYSEVYIDAVAKMTEKMVLGEKIKPEEGFALLLRETLGDKEKVKGFLESFKDKPKDAVAKAIDKLPVSDDVRVYLADNLDKIVKGLPKDLDAFMKMCDDAFSKVKTNSGVLSPWESFVLKLKELEKSKKISSDKAEKIINTAKSLAEKTMKDEKLGDALGALSRLMVETVEEKVPTGGLRPLLVKVGDMEKIKKGEEVRVEGTATLSTEKEVPREGKVVGTYSVDVETFRRGAKVFNELLKKHGDELEKLFTDPKTTEQLFEAVGKAYLTGDFSFIKKALEALEKRAKELELREKIREASEQEAGKEVVALEAGKATGASGKLASMSKDIGKAFSKLNVQELYDKIVDFVKEMRRREPPEKEQGAKVIGLPEFSVKEGELLRSSEGAFPEGGWDANLKEYRYRTSGLVFDTKTGKYKWKVQEYKIDMDTGNPRLVSERVTELPTELFDVKKLAPEISENEKLVHVGISTRGAGSDLPSTYEVRALVYDKVTGKWKQIVEGLEWDKKNNKLVKGERRVYELPDNWLDLKRFDEKLGEGWELYDMSGKLDLHSNIYEVTAIVRDKETGKWKQVKWAYKYDPESKKWGFSVEHYEQRELTEDTVQKFANAKPLKSDEAIKNVKAVVEMDGFDPVTGKFIHRTVPFEEFKKELSSWKLGIEAGVPETGKKEVGKPKNVEAGAKKILVEEKPVEEYDIGSDSEILEKLQREFELGRSGGSSETGKGATVKGKGATLGAGRGGLEGGSGATVVSGRSQLIQKFREMPPEDVASMFYFLGNMPFVSVVEEVGAPQALTGLYNSIAGLGRGALAYGRMVWDVAGKTFETPMIVAIGSRGKNYAVFVPKSDGGKMLVNIRVDPENKAVVDIYGDRGSFEEVKPVIRGIIDRLGVRVESASLVPDVSGHGGLDDARLAMKEKAGVVVVNDTVSTRVDGNIVTGNVTGVATPSGAKLYFELSGASGRAGGEVEVTSDGTAMVTVRGSGVNVKQAEEVGKKIASSLGASPANINVARSGETLLSEVRRDAENVKIVPTGMLKIEEDVDLKKFWDKYGVMPDFVLEVVGRDRERWYLFRRLPDALLRLAKESLKFILGLKPVYEPIVAVAQLPELATELQLRTDQVTVTKQKDVPIVKVTRPPLIPIVIPAPSTAPTGKATVAEKLEFKQREKLVI